LAGQVAGASKGIAKDYFVDWQGRSAIAKINAILSEEGLLRAMWEVGYFPPTIPPPVVLKRA
jgi:hypothetical protein